MNKYVEVENTVFINHSRYSILWDWYFFIYFLNKYKINFKKNKKILITFFFSLQKISNSTDCMLLKRARGQFRCNQCSYRSNFRQGLNRHHRIHTGDFLRCHLCPNRYTAKSDLMVHLQGHSGKLECKPCKKKYISKIGLSKHMKKFHSVDNKISSADDSVARP